MIDSLTNVNSKIVLHSFTHLNNADANSK